MIQVKHWTQCLAQTQSSRMFPLQLSLWFEELQWQEIICIYKEPFFQALPSQFSGRATRSRDSELQPAEAFAEPTGKGEELGSSQRTGQQDRGGGLKALTLKLPPTRLTLGQTGKGSYFGISRKEVVCECLSQFSRISLPPWPFLHIPLSFGECGND